MKAPLPGVLLPRVLAIRGQVVVALVGVVFLIATLLGFAIADRNARSIEEAQLHHPTERLPSDQRPVEIRAPD